MEQTPHSPGVPHVPHVVVVGAGFSGTLVTTHLLRTVDSPMRLTLLERRAEIGRGVAYGTNTLAHLLNVRAAQMSAFPDQPKHLVQWLDQKKEQWQSVTGNVFSEDSFVPRKIYGCYLEGTLQAALASSDLTFERIRDEAVGIIRKNQRYEIKLLGGTSLEADKIVLAMGNFPPSNPFPHDVTSDLMSSTYAADPWSISATSALTQDRPVLLVGTGLTTVDLILSLHEQGFRGPVHAISRHGFLPQSHQAAFPIEDFISLGGSGTITQPVTSLKLLRAVRKRIRASPKDWRAVVDSLRPHNQELWKSLSLDEKRRFQRHLKAHWDVHRHRIAPEIAKKISALREQGWLQLEAGRLRAFHEVREGVDVVFTPRHSEKNKILRVQRIINCSGPAYRNPRRASQLFAQLEDAGLMRPHPLMGVDTDDRGALYNSRGVASRDLFTLGSIRIGSLWESIAVPELRDQAAIVAREVISGLGTGGRDANKQINQHL